jgi:hypothetical protein
VRYGWILEGGMRINKWLAFIIYGRKFRLYFKGDICPAEIEEIKPPELKLVFCPLITLAVFMLGKWYILPLLRGQDGYCILSLTCYGQDVEINGAPTIFFGEGELVVFDDSHRLVYRNPNTSIYENIDN